VLEIGRASPPIPFDLDYARNPPLLPRHLRIKERMNAKGDVLIASDPAEIEIETDVRDGYVFACCSSSDCGVVMDDNLRIHHLATTALRAEHKSPMLEPE
jgi:hypothetical protein